MIELIEKNRDKLVSLCRKYNVAELDVFGSAATGDFDPSQSDIDFLVEFSDDLGKGRFDMFIGFLEELKSIFKRPIDLVEPGGLRNPYFIDMVNKTKQKIDSV